MTNPQESMTELLPCPFCGGAASTWPWHSPAEDSVAVGCENEDCLHEPWHSYESLEKGVAAWNTRAGIPDLLAEKEELRRENERLREVMQWATDTLYEINPSNYDHDEVCHLNHRSVEVILGLDAALKQPVVNDGSKEGGGDA